MHRIRAVRFLARIVRTSLIIAVLGFLIGSQTAHADQMTIVNPGISINVTMTAGNGVEIVNQQDILAGNAAGTVDGLSVPWMFCVDFTRDIYVPGTYRTDITSNGTIHGSSVNNAGQVAWLVQQFGSSAAVGAPDYQEAGAALQAAIWATIYVGQFTLNNSGATTATEMADYNGYLTALANAGNPSAPLASLNWLSPFNSDGTPAQGQITISTSPEPSALAIAALSGLGMVCYHLRRRSRTKADGVADP